MKYAPETLIAICIFALSPCLIGAEDWTFETLTTIKGATYENVTIKEKKVDSIVVWHKDGVVSVAHDDIPPSILDVIGGFDVDTIRDNNQLSNARKATLTGNVKLHTTITYLIGRYESKLDAERNEIARLENVLFIGSDPFNSRNDSKIRPSQDTTNTREQHNKSISSEISKKKLIIVQYSKNIKHLKSKLGQYTAFIRKANKQKNELENSLKTLSTDLYIQ